MERGTSSADRTSAKELRAETMLDSGRWKAGFREEMMFGVRTSTEGLMELLRCATGSDCRSGRKV